MRRLQEVEKHATPMTRRLLQKHMRMLEAHLARAQAEFLSAEPVPVVQQAYRIMAVTSNARPRPDVTPGRPL